MVRAMTELVAGARALTEGDFERTLDVEVQGKFGELAVSLETLRESLRTLSSRFVASAHLIPQAGQGVAEISQQAELSVNSILSLVDDMCIDQTAVSEMLGKAAADGAGALEVARLQEIAATTSASLRSLMSFLSFQDVVRQRAEQVQEIIEIVDEKIRDLLARFKVPLETPAEEKAKAAPGYAGLTASDAVDQSSIDDLFD